MSQAISTTISKAPAPFVKFDSDGDLGMTDYYYNLDILREVDLEAFSGSSLESLLRELNGRGKVFTIESDDEHRFINAEIAEIQCALSQLGIETESFQSAGHTYLKRVVEDEDDGDDDATLYGEATDAAALAVKGAENLAELCDALNELIDALQVYNRETNYDFPLSNYVDTDRLENFGGEPSEEGGYSYDANSIMILEDRFIIQSR